jgi:holo-[acyl-carrier protein] synthase
MISGVGIDIVEVPELESRLSRETFLNVFSAREIEYADSLPLRRAEILAGRWAAKEAFAKALGTGIRAEWSLAEIEVVNDAQGRPRIELSARIAGMLPQGGQVHCSISHSRGVAAAVVIIET